MQYMDSKQNTETEDATRTRINNKHSIDQTLFSNSRPLRHYMDLCL